MSAAVVDPDDGPMGQLVNYIEKGRAPQRVRQMLWLYGTWRMVNTMTKPVITKARSKITHRVSIMSDDELYPLVHKWLIEQVPPGKLRSFRVRSSRRANATYFDGGVTVRVVLDGCRIDIDLTREGNGDRSHGGMEVEPDGSSNRIRFPSSWRDEAITFTAYSQAGRKAVEKLIDGMADAHYQSDRRPRFFIAGQWGGWDNRSDVPARSVDSVFLPDGIMEEWVQDLDEFLASEQRYVELGQPWHRCWMLMGPPGTGKSSAAQAIANRFGLDVYYVPIGDIRGDTSLIRMVSEVKRGSLLLLEDIDVFSVAVDRENIENDDNQFKTSLSGLLNVLDGVATPHGLLTVMTTNHPEKLDPRLMRRADRKFDVGPLDRPSFAAMFRRFYGSDPGRTFDNLVGSTVAGIFKQHMDDPASALAALIEGRDDVPAALDA